MTTAIDVGILSPLMLCLFGWLEKVIREDCPTESTNGRLKEHVTFHLEKYPEMSTRDIESPNDFSHTAMRRFRQKNIFNGLIEMLFQLHSMCERASRTTFFAIRINSHCGKFKFLFMKSD